MEACQSARTADLQRASMFLEKAAEVRKGSAQQRRVSRSRPTKAQKEIDKSIAW